ncbi:class I glutamine amidotransferase-like protein [Dendryphion nanum]|uniref:D-lactate dehydratase n=1 Tax=Dendryphion nanum TaxID=256645 RepID=A0A9P9DCP6_9PLEO|nr:class I glutamine amidotransferase-like protein [Dendryphion nanum]
MVKALILVADGSEEIEFVTIYDVLVRAGFEVVTAGVELEDEKGVARLSRNLRLLPDHPTLTSVPHQTAHSNFDILLLPGGAPGAKTFCTTPTVLSLISDFRRAGKWVGAICAATTALVASAEAHGDGKVVVTSHPSVEGVIREKGWIYSEERVVIDSEEKLVTSRGPGTALGWALEVVEILGGEEKRKEVEGPMIVAEVL